MIYKMKIKENKGLSPEEIEGLLVYGDPEGMIKEAVVAEDFITIKTYAAVDLDEYQFWNDEDGQEVLWIEERTKEQIQKEFAEIIWNAEISNMLLCEYLNCYEDINDQWISLEKECQALGFNVFELAVK